MCHPPDQTDAQDYRGSLDRLGQHVTALTYSMNTLLQMRMVSVSLPLVYRAVLSLNITILKVWFPILLHSCNDSTSQIVLYSLRSIVRPSLVRI